MDTRTIFRNLVTNTYIPGLDYFSNYLSFQTVFYNPGNFRYMTPYCYCTCGFEHEYLDYISESGEINEVLYEKIVQSIIDGKCPHVEQVPQEYVQETGIFPLHVAAALGTTEAIVTPSDQRFYFNNVYISPESLTGLFQLTPFNLSAIKNRHACTPASTRTGLISLRTRYLMYAERSTMDKRTIRLQQIPILELFVKKNNIKLLQSYLKNYCLDPEGAFSAIKFTFEHNLNDIQETLLQAKPSSTNCCELSIVYNRPEVFDLLLQNLSFLHNIGKGRVSHEIGAIKVRLSKACYVLQRKQCEMILTKYNIDTIADMSNLERIKTLLSLLKLYPNFEAEILSQLKQISTQSNKLNNQEASRNGSILKTFSNFFRHLAHKTTYRKEGNFLKLLYRGDWLNHYVKEGATRHGCRVLKTVIDFGASINSIDEAGMTPLIHVLTTFRHSVNERQRVELLIYENPDFTLNQSAVTIAIKQCKFGSDLSAFDIDGDLLMDARQHGWFGHDDVDSLALNYMAPLLIECGFPTSKETDIVLETLRGDMHKVEREYILSCLQTPRLLSLICRDTLRNHFKGRYIHQFVSISNIPQTIKDFILLKPLLKCIPDELLYR